MAKRRGKVGGTCSTSLFRLLRGKNFGFFVFEKLAFSFCSCAMVPWGFSNKQ